MTKTKPIKVRVDVHPNPHVGKPVKTAPIYDDKEITKALAIIASDTCTGSIEEELKEHHGALAAAVYRAAWDAGLCEGWDIGRDCVLHSNFDAGFGVRRKAG